MNNRLLNLVGSFSLVVAALSMFVWLTSLTRPFVTLSDFMDSGKRFALVRYYIYLSVTPAPSPQELSSRANLAKLQRAIDAKETPPVASAERVTFVSSGDS